MADFVVKDPPEYNQALRKLETTDPNHADVFNALFGQLVNNDAFLAALARGTARVLEGHRDNGDIHVSTQEKQGWDAKAGTAVATQGAAGLMAAADKKKLDGVAAGAEANQNAYSNVRVGDATVTANGKMAALVLEAGANITLAADNAAKKVTIAAQRDGGNADTLDGYHAAHFAASSEVEGLKKSVSDGKRSVAAAVTAKGVTTAADATFAAIAANIGKISTGTGGGGKDVTVSGTTTSMTPVKVNLSDYGITDYNVLVIQVVDSIVRKGIPGASDIKCITYYENIIIIKNGNFFFLLGNANNISTFNNSFPLNNNVDLNSSFIGTNFYRTRNELSYLPKSVGVGKYTYYSMGPYDYPSNMCEYTTRIIAF